MSNLKEMKNLEAKELAQIFNEIQLSSATHKKLSLKIKRCLKDVKILGLLLFMFDFFYSF